jgi:hypothetical protein
MKIEYIDTKDGFITKERSLQWVDPRNAIVNIHFNCFVQAVYSELYSVIVILENEKLSVYDLYGIHLYQICLPKELEQSHHIYFGIQEQPLSKSNVAIILTPNSPRNEWGDSYQFEIDIERKSVGRELCIYR